MSPSQIEQLKSILDKYNISHNLPAGVNCKYIEGAKGHLLNDLQGFIMWMRIDNMSEADRKDIYEGLALKALQNQHYDES